MNILLIEPDKILGDLLQSTMSSLNHEVEIAKTAQAALDKVSETCDVIVLEIQLGLHNGIEFLYELRSYDELQKIPVVLHTMNKNVLDESYRESLHDLGVRSVLYKPNATTEQLIEAAVTAGQTV